MFLEGSSAEGSAGDVSPHVAQARHTAESVRRELRGRVFRLGPSGPWEVAERYLSGDVAGKLAEARGWATLDAAFAENVAALQARAIRTS